MGKFSGSFLENEVGDLHRETAQQRHALDAAMTILFHIGASLCGNPSSSGLIRG
jgi:hypothetical protein